MTWLSPYGKAANFGVSARGPSALGAGWDMLAAPSPKPFPKTLPQNENRNCDGFPSDWSRHVPGVLAGVTIASRFVILGVIADFPPFSLLCFKVAHYLATTALDARVPAAG